MENSLKQRIIGAIVLVALGVIFLPSILKEKTSNGVFESKIPKKPEIIADYEMDTFKIDELLAEETLETQKVKEQAKAIRSKVDLISDEAIIDRTVVNTMETNEKSRPTIEEVQSVIDNPRVVSSETGAWVIQVASFSKKENANKLVSKLIKMKNKAYKNKVQVDKKLVYRVFVGPFIDKSRAKKAISLINQLSGTKSMLKVFIPIKH